MNEWTVEEDATAKKMAEEGYSAAIIAQRIGRSRSAVLGRLHRRGISKPRPKKDEQRRRFSPVRPKKFKKNTPPPRKTTTPALGYTTLTQLEPHHCRWPFGDPKNADFHFCGRARAPGKPYCYGHCAEAYVPNKPRADA